MVHNRRRVDMEPGSFSFIKMRDGRISGVPNSLAVFHVTLLVDNVYLPAFHERSSLLYEFCVICQTHVHHLLTGFVVE